MALAPPPRRTRILIRGRDELRRHAAPSDQRGLAFDGDFAAAGFVEVRPHWQEVHRLLGAFNQHPRKPKDAWLTRELREFLRENGLADLPLTERLVEALEARAELDEALELLLSRTADKVASVRGPVAKGRVRWEKRDWEYPILPRDPQWGPGSRLVWGLGNWEQKAWFYAGLRCEDGGPLTKPANEGWILGLENCAEEKFLSEPEGTKHWLGAVREVEQLLDLTKPGDQAEPGDQAAALAGWVISVFDLIARESPPA